MSCIDYFTLVDFFKFWINKTNVKIHAITIFKRNFITLPLCLFKKRKKKKRNEEYKFDAFTVNLMFFLIDILESIILFEIKRILKHHHIMHEITSTIKIA